MGQITGAKDHGLTVGCGSVPLLRRFGEGKGKMYRERKNKAVCCVFIGILIIVVTIALWRTPITKYKPKNIDEHAIVQILIRYITSRNNRDVSNFLSTLHKDSKYMITKDFVATKSELETFLPGLWMQNDDNSAAFGRCMAWECWHENYYRTVMLINPQFQISKDRAYVELKIVSGIFMDDNYFHLVREKSEWSIVQFSRPIY